MFCLHTATRYITDIEKCFDFLLKKLIFQNSVNSCFRGGDLKSMLDSNKDVLKLEAMKILIGVKIRFALYSK